MSPSSLNTRLQRLILRSLDHTAAHLHVAIESRPGHFQRAADVVDINRSIIKELSGQRDFGIRGATWRTNTHAATGNHRCKPNMARQFVPVTKTYEHKDYHGEIMVEGFIEIDAPSPDKAIAAVHSAFFCGRLSHYT